MSLSITIAAPFRHTRKERLKKNEIVYYLAFDRKWMSIEQANNVIQKALEEGLITFEGEMIVPLFIVEQVDIPLGFKPSSSMFARSDALQELLKRLSAATGLPVTGIVSQMNDLIHQQFDGNLRPQAAIVVLARRYDVPFEDLLPALREQMLKNES